ncbi:MAG: hypothetical protein HY822_02095 [Acidobacteria bacterium]|nr:hypothetical protein [Acidobacteriota bacterium]
MSAPVSAPAFAPEELALLAELLEREQRQLLSELSHTATAAFKNQLRGRIGMVERLLNRLRPIEG